MNFEILIGKFGIYLTSFLVCLVSGFIPLVNTEAYLAVVSAISQKSVMLPVIAISTFTHIITKLLIYLSGRGVLNLPMKRIDNKLVKVKEKFEKWKTTTDLFIFMSASTGIPPFYIVSFLAGNLKFNLKRFCVFGTLGMLLRFSITVLFPQLIKGYIH